MRIGPSITTDNIKKEADMVGYFLIFVETD